MRIGLRRCAGTQRLKWSWTAETNWFSAREPWANESGADVTIEADLCNNRREQIASVELHRGQSNKAGGLCFVEGFNGQCLIYVDRELSSRAGVSCSFITIQCRNCAI